MITSNTRIGENFAGKPKRMTLPRLLMFSGGSLSASGFPRANIHTNDAFARNTGLPGLCASGTQYQGNLVELLIDVFGDRWFTSGRLDARLTSLVHENVVVTAHASITAKETLADGTKFTADVWSERDDGEKVLVGTASCVLPA